MTIVVIGNAGQYNLVIAQGKARIGSVYPARCMARPRPFHDSRDIYVPLLFAGEGRVQQRAVKSVTELSRETPCGKLIAVARKPMCNFFGKMHPNIVDAHHGLIAVILKVRPDPTTAADNP